MSSNMLNITFCLKNSCIFHMWLLSQENNLSDNATNTFKNSHISVFWGQVVPFRSSRSQVKCFKQFEALLNVVMQGLLFFFFIKVLNSFRKLLYASRCIHCQLNTSSNKNSSLSWLNGLSQVVRVCILERTLVRFLLNILPYNSQCLICVPHQIL